MKGYWIARIDVTDEALYPEYGLRSRFFAGLRHVHVDRRDPGLRSWYVIGEVQSIPASKAPQ